MKRGIGSHHATKGEFDTWLTPLAIVRALGTFDLLRDSGIAGWFVTGQSKVP